MEAKAPDLDLPRPIMTQSSGQLTAGIGWAFICRVLAAVAVTLVWLALSTLPAAGAAGSNDATTPAITAVLNNYSYILPGSPYYGIAPGSIFVIFGTGLATPGASADLQDSTKGLPLKLNGASVAVTVSGLTVYPALYYATPTQIAAVLPSTTPLGAGTVTVTYNGVSSPPATTQVVQSALGLATMSGDGTGLVMATDANYHFISPMNSAAGGQIITLWGTGLGASPEDSDTTYTSTPHQVAGVLIAIIFGSQQMPVVWAGRSGYPGLDQINVQLPVPNYTPAVCGETTCTQASWVTLPLGCVTTLSEAAVNTGVGSNTVELPISIAGGACTQPPFVLPAEVAQAVSGQATVNFGSLSLSEGAQPMAGGSFYSISGVALAAFGGSGTGSTGSCVIAPTGAAPETTNLSTGGYLAVNAPGGNQALATVDYANYGGVVPASLIPPAGAMFTFVNEGSQYATIGQFTAAVTYPNPLTWTNQDSIGKISRAQGVQLTWTGGDADGVVAIRGSSFAAAGSQTPSASFLCSVPASAGQFTVPASILQSLPAGAGTLTVENQSAAQPISASGLGLGYAFAGAVFTINTAYN